MVSIHQFIASFMAGDTLTEFVLIELGACVGIDTQKFAMNLMNLRRKYRIYAFEPVPQNHDLLIRVASSVNRRTELGVIKCSKQAVGAVHGETEFWLAGPFYKYRGSSSLHTPELVNADHNWPDMTFERIQVKCTTLDIVGQSERIGNVDFIWCDTQGAEADIIRGGPSVFSRTKYFFTEYHEADLHKGTGITAEGLLELLKVTDSGWEILHDYGGEVLFERCNS